MGEGEMENEENKKRGKWKMGKMELDAKALMVIGSLCLISVEEG
jgi:hypothetical protein